MTTESKSNTKLVGLPGKPNRRARRLSLKPDQLTDGLGAQSFQESSQCGLIRETAQTKNLQKKPVVLRNLGLVDPLHAHDDRVKQGQNQFRWVISLIGRQSHKLLRAFFQEYTFAKTMNQYHPAKMRQVGSLEENIDISSAFWHNTQTVHLGRFLCGKYYGSYYTPVPSVK